MIKFQGCYHGWHDSVAMNVISPADRVGGKDPLSQGILPEVLDATIVCRFNDVDDVERALTDHDVAAIILEPIPHNIGAVLPKPGFLERLRELATKHGTVLVFDEVITGFRHGLGGYQAIAGVTPDLTTLGKAMANGWPVSALGGKAELMDLFSTTPGQPAFFAGTFNGHPATTAAALATLDKLQREPVHEHVFRLGERTREGLRALYARLGVPVVVSGFGSVFVTLLPRGAGRELRRPAPERRRPVRRLPARADAPRDLRAAAEPEAEPLLVRPHRRGRRSAARGDGDRGRGGAGGPRVTDSPVSCTIDLSAPGKQLGRLQLPKITNTGGWASTFIPIASIANGDGPNVLVLAGNHGDEYEGQVAALRLIQELEPEQVSGRVTSSPCSRPRRRRRTRGMWPSGVNFNRSFPGSPDGPPDEQLADFLTRFLFPPADVVIDMHSGGRTAWFVPCSHMHVVDDAEQRRAMLAGMQAWNSDYHFLYIDVNGTGLLPVEAEDQGKLVITTELGGGGRVPPPCTSSPGAASRTCCDTSACSRARCRRAPRSASPTPSSSTDAIPPTT